MPGRLWRTYIVFQKKHKHRMEEKMSDERAVKQTELQLRQEAKLKVSHIVHIVLVLGFVLF